MFSKIGLATVINFSELNEFVDFFNNIIEILRVELVELVGSVDNDAKVLLYIIPEGLPVFNKEMFCLVTKLAKLRVGSNSFFV